MTDNNKTGPKADLDQAQSLYILIPQYHTHDHVAAALGLFHAAKKAGKNAFIASPTPISSDLRSLPGIDKISEEIGNRNLVVSLKLNSTDDIDKVSYHVNEDDSTFNLVIQPKASVDPINSDNVSYSYSGAQADMVIMIGANSFQDYAHFYEHEKKVFHDAVTLAVTTQPPQNNFATHHYASPEHNSLTEATYAMVKELGLADLGDSSASAFLAGLEHATNNLQNPNTTPETFELVAKFMKQGGRRGLINHSPDELTNQSQSSTPAQPSVAPPAGSAPVPNDWLSPKVYKGSQTNQGNPNQPQNPGGRV